MRLKIGLFFVLLLSILQVTYKSTLVSIFAKPVLKALDYQAFSDQSKNILLWVGLGLLLCCLFFTKRDNEKSSSPSIFPWIGSFILLLSVCVTFVLIVNPDGRFPWNERNAYLPIAPRPIKPNLYQKLKTAPDVLILGSSISFTVPPSYFHQKWGVSAFNMSLNGGTPIDFFNTLNYIISANPHKKLPSTLLVEILSLGLKVNTATETPVKLIRYMSADQAFLTIGVIGDHLIRASSFTDSIFTVLFVDTNRWEIWIDFASDGNGIRIKNTMPKSQYQSAVKNDVNTQKMFLACDLQGLSPFGKESVEKLVGLSRMHHLSIVFYRPPINADFYTISKTKPDTYAPCNNVLNNYMQSLTQQNPNVFYKDLSNDPKISSLRQEIYTDGHHLMENGNILVLEALNEEIKSALQWAKTNRPK